MIEKKELTVSNESQLSLIAELRSGGLSVPPTRLAVDEPQSLFSSRIKDMENHDVFICHANEDKETVVHPLTVALEQAGVSFWEDQGQIKWGDSITKKINEGLQTSSYVIVVISEAFLSKEWPQAELDAAFNREMSDGKTHVLPLFVGDRNELTRMLPLLAGKRGLDWSGDPSNVVHELQAILKQKESQHPGSTSPENPSEPLDLSEEGLDATEEKNKTFLQCLSLVFWMGAFLTLPLSIVFVAGNNLESGWDYLMWCRSKYPHVTTYPILFSIPLYIGLYKQLAQSPRIRWREFVAFALIALAAFLAWDESGKPMMMLFRIESSTLKKEFDVSAETDLEISKTVFDKLSKLTPDKQAELGVKSASWKRNFSNTAMAIQFFCMVLPVMICLFWLTVDCYRIYQRDEDHQKAIWPGVICLLTASCWLPFRLWYLTNVRNVTYGPSSFAVDILLYINLAIVWMFLIHPLHCECWQARAKKFGAVSVLVLLVFVQMSGILNLLDDASSYVAAMFLVALLLFVAMTDPQPKFVTCPNNPDQKAN